jgi:hypothetical protein
MRSLLALRALPWGVALLLALATLASTHVAPAQSAADKSTARDLAIAGIAAYDDGKYADALDKLERAEALYDAHVHLVYIARCQVALGKLVEASESYRALGRKPLPPGASEAVRNAQVQGAKELEALEPRIPYLRILVEPADAPDLQLILNGEPVAAATIGVERPANPGETVLRVGATGYKWAEARVTLAEGAHESVTVTLEEGPPAPAAPGDSAGAGQPSGAGSTSATAERPPRPVSFVLEPRVAGAIPFGSIGDRAAGEIVRGGGGLEVRFGVHFKRRYTALAMVGAYGLAPRSGFEDEFAFSAFDDPATTDFDDADAISRGRTGNVALGQGGVGFMMSSPHHQYGWFAEADLLVEAMMGSTEITIADDYRDPSLNPQGLSFADCKVDTSFSGGAVRLSGGGVIPASRILQLAPFAAVSLGKYTDVTLSGDCEQTQTMTSDTTHGWIGIGVGGQFLIAE